MKLLDIALKDMTRHFRSAFGLVMMFVAPLLVTGLIALAFGGLAGDGGFSLPQTRVVVADQDEGGDAGFRAGGLLLDAMNDPDMASYMVVSTAADPAAAREAVELREADVAVIIPPDLSAAVTTHDGSAVVEIVHDPTLTLGPGLVKAVVDGVVDAFNGARIATHVTAAQLAEQGLPGDRVVGQVAMRYAEWVQAQGAERDRGEYAAIAIQPPPGVADDVSLGARIIGTIAVGMVLFFVFFTAASTAESIVREDEEGTLARLFTTPTSRSTILAGKLLAVGLTLIVQTIVLILLTRLIFGISWGRPLAVTMVLLGTIVAAAGFGVCVMSFVQNTRQSGPVMGGVLTVSAMLGGLMTTGIPNLPAALTTVTLFTPHGWALHAWKLAMEGAAAGALVAPLLVLLGYGAALFGVGVIRFRRRFA